MYPKRKTHKEDIVYIVSHTASSMHVWAGFLTCPETLRQGLVGAASTLGEAEISCGMVRQSGWTRLPTMAGEKGGGGGRL